MHQRSLGVALRDPNVHVSLQGHSAIYYVEPADSASRTAQRACANGVRQKINFYFVCAGKWCECLAKRLARFVSSHSARPIGLLPLSSPSRVTCCRRSPLRRRRTSGEQQLRSAAIASSSPRRSPLFNLGFCGAIL